MPLIGPGAHTAVWYLIVAYLVYGTEAGLVRAPITNTALSGMPRDQAGVAGAIASACRQTGAAVGVAVTDVIIAANSAGFVHASHAASAVVAGCGVMVIVLGIASTGRWALATAQRNGARLCQAFALGERRARALLCPAVAGPGAGRRDHVWAPEFSPRRCRIREAKADNKVTAETPSWEDDMKYIALLYGEPDAGPAPRTPELMQMLGEFQSATTATAEAGILVDSSPLQPPQTATTVRVRDGETQLSDGPFAEIKEQLGGYYILDCEDRDMALMWSAISAPPLCRDRGPRGTRPGGVRRFPAGS